jgi:hypothetical protein
MTIPKNAGLSHLADVSNEQALTFHYPVKKKGQPRRLRPNLDAIRYLEIESETDTEIREEYGAGEAVFNDEEVYLGVEFKIERALGYFSARQRNMYPWPMFQVFQVSGFKAKMIGYLSPCPDCDDWSRTSRCTEHHDRDGFAGLKKGDERRRARQRERDRATGRRVVNAYASPNSGLVRDANGNIRVAVDSPEPLYLSAVPDELYRPVRERWAEAVASLPDGSITINNVVLEVNGETLQGVQSFTIHIDEPDGAPVTTEGDARE